MKTEFYFDKRRYTCGLYQVESVQELRIKNLEGLVLAVKQGQKTGLLGKRREDAKQVDVSQPRYYNLIKAALNALKLEKKDQLIRDKNEMISEIEKMSAQKDRQLDILNQQITILNTKLGYLSSEQQQQLRKLKTENQKLEDKIQKEREHSERLKSKLEQSEQVDIEQVKLEIIDKIGNSVWNRLAHASRKELCDAYRQYKLVNSESFTAEITDYSLAAMGLGLVAEREIMNPFCQSFYQFLINHQNVTNQIAERKFEVGRVVFKQRGKYTLGSLPSLLSEEWEAYRRDGLERENCPEPPILYQRVSWGADVSDRDRQLIKQFLQKWQHPLSNWLAKGETAASLIDQISDLRNRAAHHEPILYLWQFKILWLIMIGGKNKKGILKEIYGN
jgi:hypothetical protein